MYAWARVPNLRKRTGDDIWKNLFELPLIETTVPVPEGTFRELPEVRALFADGEVPALRLVCGNVKHVLSHRVIYTNFYEVALPENSASFSAFQRVKTEDLGQYAVSRLVHAFLEKYL